MSGCWLWDLQWGRTNYGRVYWKGRPRSAHRVSYEVFRGPIPQGMTLDHTCRVRPCINPRHLEPVTSAENMSRGYRARIELGVVHVHAKLTEDDVLAMRALAGQITTRELARRYGVTRSQVWRIIHRRKWTYLTEGARHE